MFKNQAKWPLFFFITAACLFVYFALRAWYVPPVHDEAATFFIYIHTGNFLPWEAFFDANNHLLNSALSTLFARLFGDHIFVLRLASLLFFPVYAWYVYKISVVFFSRYEQIFFGLGLLFVHNYLEYFGYCRGYGMGLACCMALLYDLLAYMRNQRLRDLCCFSFFVPLALMSNLNLLLVGMVAVGYLCVNLVIHRKKSIFVFVLWNGAWLALFTWYGMLLQRSGALYYGGERGLVADTVTSLSTLLFDSKNQVGVYFIMLPAILSLLLLPMLIRYKKLNTFFTEPVWAIHFLFWSCVCAIPVMHAVLGTKYPEDRTVMHLVLLSVVMFFMTFKEVIPPFLRSVAYGAFGLTQVVLFFISANLLYTTFWKGERIPYSFYERTQKSIQAHETYVTGYRLNALIWAYYNYRSGDEVNPLHSIDYLQQQGDYILAGDSVYTDSVSRIYQMVEHDPSTGKTLLERRKKTKLQPIDTLYIADNSQSFMYYNIVQYNDTAVANLDLCFEISGTIKTNARPAPEIILKTLERGAPPEDYASMNINLNWLYNKPVQEYKVHQRLYTPNVKKQDRNVIVFIFNPLEQQYSFSNLRVIVYKIVYP